MRLIKAIIGWFKRLPLFPRAGWINDPDKAEPDREKIRIPKLAHIPGIPRKAGRRWSEQFSVEVEVEKGQAEIIKSWLSEAKIGWRQSDDAAGKEKEKAG
jgi:hypothetical protein